MRRTTVRISVTQDGLLPEEVTVLGTIFIPAIQKQILRSVGFEAIDKGAGTFTGVMPVKITTNKKLQEIEFEVGALSDFRKKVVHFVNDVSLREFDTIEPKNTEASTKEKESKQKKNKTEKDKKTKAPRKPRTSIRLKKASSKTSSKKTVRGRPAAKKTQPKKKATIKKVKIAKTSPIKKATKKKVSAKSKNTKKRSKK